MAGWIFWLLSGWVLCQKLAHAHPFGRHGLICQQQKILPWNDYGRELNSQQIIRFLASFDIGQHQVV